MTTETLDKLYLEWSQYTQARTGRELKMQTALSHCIERLKYIGECDDTLRSDNTIRDARAAIGPPVIK